MRILFVSFEKSSMSNAYNHRIFNLERHCRQAGAETSKLFLGDLFFGSPVLIQPLNIPFILKYLRKFDVIHAGGSGAAFFFALVSPLLGNNTKVVYDVHSDVLTEVHLTHKGLFDFAGYFAEFEMIFTEYVAIRFVNYYVASSSELKRRLLKRKSRIKPENIEIIVNGVDLQQFRPQEETVSSSSDRNFTVTYAGSFYKVESVDILVRAAEILRDECITFKFIGFRTEDSSYKLEIQKRIGDKAVLVDWLSRNELVVELQKSDVLVIPGDSTCSKQSKNRSAVFVTKFAEFLAVGKPVIITTLDLPSKIVKTFDCGFVSEPNAESLALSILEAKQAPREVLLKKGQNGRRYAESELDVNILCKRYLRFLNKLFEN